MRLRVSSNSKDGKARIGNRLLPRRFTLTAINDDDSPNLRMVFAVLDGVPQCRGVHIESSDGGREVQSGDLRALRLEDFLEFAMTETASVVTKTTAAGETTAVHTVDPDERARTLKVLQRARSDARRKVTDDMLREVAAIYRTNLDNNPTQAVADHYDKSPRSARLYVKQARDKGFLGAAVKGKAGEQS